MSWKSPPPNRDTHICTSLSLQSKYSLVRNPQILFSSFDFITITYAFLKLNARLPQHGLYGADLLKAVQFSSWQGWVTRQRVIIQFWYQFAVGPRQSLAPNATPLPNITTHCLSVLRLWGLVR